MVDWKYLDYVIKTGSVVCGVLLIVISIISFINLTINPAVIASRIAFILIGIKIVLCNFDFQLVRNNFPYMYIPFWNGLFCAVCGCLMIDGVFSVYFILGLVMIGLGLAIIVLGFIRPAKKEYIDS